MIIKKLLKKFIPNYLWKILKLIKTVPARLSLDKSSIKPNYLDFNHIKKLLGSFPEVAKYNYDEQACRKRGEERASFLARLFASSKNKKILELGCSDGMTSMALKKNGLNPISLDIIDQRLEVVKNSEIPFIKSSAEKIPLEDNGVDAIFSYNSMEHFDDPQKVLNEINRILKPGGYFYTDFDPLYYSPRGLHAYRKINIPYLQILFKGEDLKKYAELHNLNWDELPWVNGYTIEKYHSLWKQLNNNFEIKSYKEIIDISGIDIIKKYPSCFKKENINFDNFIISGIKILLQKK
jgi:ubiquinone/menaquinone biosynthesis C-methylase UbiE